MEHAGHWGKILDGKEDWKDSDTPASSRFNRYLNALAVLFKRSRIESDVVVLEQEVTEEIEESVEVIAEDEEIEYTDEDLNEDFAELYEDEDVFAAQA